MAAIDLRRGLEHSGRGWGQERADVADGFDSEMQEWEDQLQDMQKKIEELYNEVQARRGGSDLTTDKQKNGDALEFGLGHHSNGFFDVSSHRTHGAKGNPVTTATAPKHHGNGFGCGYGPNGYGYPAGHQNGGYGYRCHGNGVASEIGDLLQDYLGQSKDMKRRNNGARHVHFNDTIAVSRDLPKHQDEARSSGGNGRNCHNHPSGSVEETKNHKNRMSQTKGSTDKENTCAKPPLRQRDPSPSAPPRSASQQHPGMHCDSPVLDRKSFGQGALADRKCGSPSVLRKFGAMLHENEGKTLTDSGVVTHRDPSPESPKVSTPGCQRRAQGAPTAASRAPTRVSAAQKCQAVDSDALTPESAPGQERGLGAPDSGRQGSHAEQQQRAVYGYPAGPQPAQRRAQVAGSPKPRPRADSGSERDAERVGGRRGCTPSRYGEQPRADYKALGGGQRNQRGQGEGTSGGRGRDDGLMELLDMLDIQHEYSAGSRGGHAAYRQDPPQINPAESSTATHTNSFSRPARPANQRPPSRWASCTLSAKITAPSGPMYRPPSPLARPASPMARTPSPALKHKSPICYSRQIETVIM
ncbi:unnamed protein product [Lota lota]